MRRAQPPALCNLPVGIVALYRPGQEPALRRGLKELLVHGPRYSDVDVGSGRVVKATYNSLVVWLYPTAAMLLEMTAIIGTMSQQ